MVSLYLGPLACGYSSSLISLKQRGFRDPDGSPDWTDHSLLLGGLVASVLPLPLSLRAFGRLKTAAMVSMILFFATVMLMVSDTSGSTFWMSRLSEFSVGLALGLHLPTQQLIIAETARPHQRLVFPLTFLKDQIIYIAILHFHRDINRASSFSILRIFNGKFPLKELLL